MSTIMSSEEPTLATLLQRVAAGDVDAFASLYRATQARLMSVAMLTLHDRAQAEDVMQDAFMRVWHHAAGFDERQATPMTWLIAIVRHKAIDLLRSTRTERSVTGTLDDEALCVPAESGAEPAQHALRSAAARALHARLGRMRGVQRQALSMAYGHDMHHQEIATALGAPLGTVKAWVRRGAMDLRRQLGSAGHHPA